MHATLAWHRLADNWTSQITNHHVNRTLAVETCYERKINVFFVYVTGPSLFLASAWFVICSVQSSASLCQAKVACMRPLSNKSSNNSSFPPVDCKYDRVLSAHDLAPSLKKKKRTNQGNYQIFKVPNVLELLCSSIYCNGIHGHDLSTHTGIISSTKNA